MSNKNRDALWKWVIIGNSGVGKTSILSRLCNDEFNNTFISTIGIDFKIKKMEFGGRNITIQIWDTAGQERFATITKSCYRGACGIILTYDMTSLASFNDVSKWIKDIQIHSGEDVHRILVGNKCDVSEGRAVSTEEGQATAARYGIPFLEVSAKTGKNIESAFVTLAEQILGLGPSVINGKNTTTSTTTTITSKSSETSKDKKSDSSSTLTTTSSQNNGDGKTSLFGWISGGTRTPTISSSAPTMGTTTGNFGTNPHPSGLLNSSASSPSSSSAIISSTTQNNLHQPTTTGLDANDDSGTIRLGSSSSGNKINTSNFNNNEIRIHQDDTDSSTMVPGKGATKSRCCS